MSLYDKLARMIEQDGRAVLVTVADVKGSAPREVGATMAVAIDGSFSGSIGGGALEWQALAEAQRARRIRAAFLLCDLGLSALN